MLPPDIEISAAAPEDISALVELARPSPEAATWGAGKYAARVDGESGIVLVARETGQAPSLHRRTVGFIVANVITPECEIENVVVAPEWRRKGLGQRLVSACLEAARTRNCTSIWLEARESNHAARRLYESCGFREAGRRPRYYRDPEEDALLLKFPF